MKCSGCGKTIPFSGDVCPYCLRDKSKDQQYTVLAFIFGGVIGWVGYFLLGVLGGVGGFGIGCVVALITTAHGKTKPPEMSVVKENELKESTSELTSKLMQLKELHTKGLLTDDEFTSKKAELLQKI